MEVDKPPKRSMTYRGLFFLTEQGELELDLNIPKCIDAVMDEQEGQWNAHEDNWDRLAAVSERVRAESSSMNILKSTEPFLFRNNGRMESL
jgi:hypothetical protein